MIQAGEPTRQLLELIEANPGRYHEATVDTGWAKVAGERGQLCDRLAIYRVPDDSPAHGSGTCTVVYGLGEYQTPDPWYFEGEPDHKTIVAEYLRAATHGAPRHFRTAVESIRYCLNLPELD